MPMRQLRSCDFCGDDAAGVYEVLPAELSPTEAEQHRVVLCSDCVGTLEAAMEPLRRRLGVDTGDGNAEPTPDPAVEGSPPPSSVADRPSSPKPPRGNGNGPEPGETTDSAPSTRNGMAEYDPGDTGSSADEHPSHAGDESSLSTEDGSLSVESEPSDDDGIPDVDPSDGTEPGIESASDETEQGRDGSVAPGDEPEEFRTVMRLLGNREFPVERDAIVDLAASAYELDDAHVRRCLDYAVDRGVLDGDGSGTLYRG